MNSGPAPVVTTHGLWMNGIESGVLRRRLRDEFGFAPQPFRYRTVARSLNENASLLGERLRGMDHPRIHLIGHSLGGLVILKALEQWRQAPVGRVVFLGTPLAGSAAANGIARLPGGRAVLGKSIGEAVLDEGPHDWSATLRRNECGLIAGSLSMGFGQFFGKLDKPNDGTVAVIETRHPELTDHVIVNSSHTGLVVSPSVVAQTAHFLHHGRFQRD